MILAWLEAWGRLLGFPRLIRFDKDGAFDNYEIRIWCSNHGIDAMFLPAEAHSRAGLLDAKVKVVKLTAKRLLSDGFKPVTAMYEANAASNEGIMYDGVVSVQLAFGWVPRGWETFRCEGLPEVNATM